MLADNDLEWYARLLADASTGRAKLSYTDAARIGRCGKAAVDDPRLVGRVLDHLAATPGIRSHLYRAATNAVI